MSLLAALLALSVGSAAPMTPIYSEGRGVDCRLGFVGLRRKATRQAHVIRVPEKPETLYTTIFNPDSRAVWRFTLEGNRAHPAAALIRTDDKGRVTQAGACGYGDGPAFQTFMTSFTAAIQSRASQEAKR